MDKLSNILTLLFCATIVNGISQPIGWAESECGIFVNPNYHYENYSTLPHGFGYRLYHFNNVIYEQQTTTIGGFTARELKFIDDTTGFMITFASEIQSLEVRKITNNYVQYIGVCPAYDFDSFVASRYTIYISSFPTPPGSNYLAITRLSDYAPNKLLLNTSVILPDSTINDTVLGIPLCPGLDKLHYLYKNSSDTLIYTIQFVVDPLVSITESKELSITVAPNPASKFIYILPFNYIFQSITIVNDLGIIKKNLFIAEQSKRGVYIGDLENGVYFLILKSNKLNKIIKFIKI